MDSQGGMGLCLLDKCLLVVLGGSHTFAESRLPLREILLKRTLRDTVDSDHDLANQISLSLLLQNFVGEQVFGDCENQSDQTSRTKPYRNSPASIFPNIIGFAIVRLFLSTDSGPTITSFQNLRPYSVLASIGALTN